MPRVKRSCLNSGRSTFNLALDVEFFATMLSIFKHMEDGVHIRIFGLASVAFLFPTLIPSPRYHRRTQGPFQYNHQLPCLLFHLRIESDRLPMWLYQCILPPKLRNQPHDRLDKTWSIGIAAGCRYSTTAAPVGTYLLSHCWFSFAFGIDALVAVLWRPEAANTYCQAEFSLVDLYLYSMYPNPLFSFDSISIISQDASGTPPSHTPATGRPDQRRHH